MICIIFKNKNNPYIMKQILENLQNWKTKKEDKVFITDLLLRADYFNMRNLDKDDSESYHLYPALEEVSREKDSIPHYQFIVYAISKNKDTDEYLMKNINNFEKFIKKFDIVQAKIGENTRIPTPEAKERKSRWTSEIKNWIDKNEVFEVFDIPKENFRFKNALITMNGHFGMKNDIEQKEGVSEIKGVVPDLIIAYENPLGSAYFDMAKLSPPFRNQAHEKQFALLNFKLFRDS